ncbi:MAG: DNA helicase-2/ATP-dependent DNA helicase PcrA [Flavobacteriaceae bacterium]|jgi:DNA helicase-2/ATP-dependent DNA helicase PcrA
MERVDYEKKFEASYNGLNDKQKEVVDTIDGPVMVVAGPGSGKTQVLSLRVANILKETDTPSHGILCLTFTDAGAVNMRERLSRFLGPEAYRVGIFTFHAFCNHIIERYPEYFFDGAHFLPADELTAHEIFTEVFENLPHDSLLRSYHPEKGFSHLPSLKNLIRDLKKGGLSPQDFNAILSENELFFKKVGDIVEEVCSQRLSKKVIGEYQKLLDSFQKNSTTSSHYFKAIGDVLFLSLEKALSIAQETEKTQSLTEWKKNHIKKDKDKKDILTAQYYAPLLREASDMYASYVDMMYQSGYYDYDDMIVRVVHTLEENETLRSELQEQFLYTLVDEFQDTNDAQMRIVRALSDTYHNENKPNICVVGDDDQAIYRFQGAELSHIMEFKERYDDVKLITMTDNYRSTQDILNLSRDIIQEGEERLENMYDDIEKVLTAKNPERIEGKVAHFGYSSQVHEFHSLVQKIEEVHAEGVPYSDIAVIARNHKELSSLVPYFHEAKIPLMYERQQNVLMEEHIRQLIVMLRFCDVSLQTDIDDSQRDALLQEILSFPFWNIPRKYIWQISRSVYKKNSKEKETDWMSEILESEHEELRTIGDFLLSVATRSQYEPVEYILESLIGKSNILEEDMQESENTLERDFVSPYKEYYFSDKMKDEKLFEYLRFLSALRVFIKALREYRQGRVLSVSDAVVFVDIHEKNNMFVNDTSPFVGGHDAVNLLSAHKAKGLEYHTVCIVSAQKDMWESNNSRNTLKLPENLPLSPAGDTEDDKRRLFFVALTRAKNNLFIFSHNKKDNGKEQEIVSFLAGREAECIHEDIDNLKLTPVLQMTVPDYTKGSFVADEKALLQPILENYRMSVTHFNNFLNLKYGGPVAFFENNILRFPQPMSVSNVFGSAVHKALEMSVVKTKLDTKPPAFSYVQTVFENEMQRARISEQDKKRYIEKGNAVLKQFYERYKKTIQPSFESEYSFSWPGVVVGDALLSGKIDILDKGESISVYDFKTGKVLEKESDDKLKYWSYENQMMFYKLLIENSRDFKGKYEVSHGEFLFVEPKKNGELGSMIIPFEDQKIEKLKKLIDIVFEKIKNLDFPDISKYSQDYKGTMEFVDDLLEGKC